MSEKRLLQIIVLIGCLVPLWAGGLGIVRGLPFLDAVASPAANSHFRYLSGLLLGVGIGFLSTVPRIELHSARIRLLAVIVVVGGIARLASVLLDGVPNVSTAFALAMELVVVPCLAVWQARIARLAATKAPSDEAAQIQ